MKFIFAVCIASLVASCTTYNSTSNSDNQFQNRVPAQSRDLTGTYLGEGIFSNRKIGLKRPAMRIYLDKAPGEPDSYYAVLIEYSKLLKMAAPYLASQKAPKLNKVVGYLNRITSEISTFKVVPGAQPGTYKMYSLKVKNSTLMPAEDFNMVLNIDPLNPEANPLVGAVIKGNPDGDIVFPSESGKPTGSNWLAKIPNNPVSQFKLAAFTYKLGHLSSTWRGNWFDLEGTYYSQYQRTNDGVLELYSENGQKKTKFIKTIDTPAKLFTNPKSAFIVGDYYVNEPVPKMYILSPTQGERSAESDVEMSGRIGLFLDVFDGSAPEAGSHMVTEMAFSNPNDPKDFMMYYEDKDHRRNVGVHPSK